MHAFNPYSLKVHDKYLPGEIKEKYHQLDRVRGNDILDFIEVFLGSLTSQLHNDTENKKTVQVVSLTRDDRSIYGWIEYGEYGIPGKIINLRKGSKTYDKEYDDSDIRNLYYNFTIPATQKTGIVLLHSAGGRGVKSFIFQKFNEYFKNTVGLSIQMKPLSHERTVQHWLDQSSIKELRVANYQRGLSADLADQLDIQRTEFIMKPKRGETFGSFTDLQSDDRTVELLSELGTDVRAVIESANGNKRVVSLKMADPVSAIEITTENVDMEDGAPNETQLHNFAVEIVGEFLDQVST